jgi:hypothetical protein
LSYKKISAMFSNFVRLLLILASASSGIILAGNDFDFQAKNILYQELQKAEAEEKRYRAYCLAYFHSDRMACFSNSGYGFQEQFCYATGIALGFEKEVAHLKINSKIKFFKISEAEAFSAQVVADDYSMLQTALRNLIPRKKDEIAQFWNLDCVGRHGIQGAHFATIKNSFFRYDPKSAQLEILGDIDKEYSKKIALAIKSSPGVKTILLSSGGGFVYEAMNAGRLIRSLRLDTQLSGSCYSACPLVFLGGVRRIVFREFPMLGFHQISLNGMALQKNDKTYHDVYRYVFAMGASAPMFIKLMHSASPLSMTNIQAGDDLFCRGNIITWAQRGCDSRQYGW